MDTMTMPETVSPVVAATTVNATATANARHAGRVAAAKRLATLATATRAVSLATTKARNVALGDLEGKARKVAARAWNATERARIMGALTDARVTFTLTKQPKGFLATALTEAGETVVRVAGLVRVVDTASPCDVDGLEVTCRLLPRSRHGLTARGKTRQGFDVETLGTASNGVRVAVRGVVAASPFVRVAASAL